MSDVETSTPEICVAGLVYFELHVETQQLPTEPGVEQFVDHLPVGVGGALNSASVAAALGRRTQLAYPSGQGLTDAAIRTRIQRLDMTTTCWRSGADPAISVVVTREGDRSFLSRADFESLREAPDLPVANWIHVPGLREAAVLDEQLRRAREQGARISVAGSWVPRLLVDLDTAEDRPWDLLVVNDKEFEQATGTDELDPRRLIDAAPEIVVTDGTRGVDGLLDGEAHSIEVEPADSVDTTGAGDAFCAGLLDARIAGAEPASALRHAARVARRTLDRHGGVVEDAETFADLQRLG